jgi:hypothetical protein
VKGMTSYLNSYVDRRMQVIIGEWDLARQDDLKDIVSRLEAVEQESSRLRAAGYAAADKLTDLENRAKQLKARR